MQEIAARVLPDGYGYEWSGMAYEEIKSGSSSTVAFAFGILIVFLILSAMYESWSLPGAVLTAVPFGLIGALVATWGRGLENDVYFQIGLLVLVGLAAKNAILIVEFAIELRQSGKSALDAAVEAGEMRLRPIIMTSLAFIFGCVPLWIALGAGMNARHSLGTGIIGGMIGASTLALVFVRCSSSCLTSLHRGAKRISRRPSSREAAHRRWPYLTPNMRITDMRALLIGPGGRRCANGLHDGTQLQAA
jgi:multidrug efflux pump